jgi:DNA polymerase III sliding clamp (beta) subunit (PCNA family)
MEKFDLLQSKPSSKYIPKAKQLKPFDLIKEVILKKTSLEILRNNVLVKDSSLYVTDLDNWLILPSNKPDGVYQLFNGDLEKSAFDPADFPPCPDLQEKDKVGGFDLPLTDDLYILNECKSDDISRVALTGLNVKGHGKDIELASCDGHRLYKKRFETAYHGDVDCILSEKTVSFLNKIRSYSAVEIEIYTCEGAKYIQVNLDDDIVYISRIIEGSYPDYNRVFPKDVLFKTVFNRADLQGALETIWPYTLKTTRAVYFKENMVFAENDEFNKKVNVNYSTISFTKAKGDFLLMPIHCEGYDFAFDADYLIDCCRFFNTETLTLTWLGNKSAFIIKGE